MTRNWLGPLKSIDSQDSTPLHAPEMYPQASLVCTHPQLRFPLPVTLGYIKTTAEAN